MAKSAFVVAFTSAVALSSAASAGITVFQADVNTLSASAGGPFGGTSHSGAVTFTNNASSVLAGLTIAGVPQAFTGVLQSMAGQIQLLNGQVQGGFFDLFLTDGSSMHSTIDPLGGGQVNPQAGQGFRIDGLSSTVTFSNLVGGTLFGGVNVTQFGPGPWVGSFLAFAFSPNGSGVDNNTDVDLYALVPAPGSAALMGLAGLAMSRRRR